MDKDCVLSDSRKLKLSLLPFVRLHTHTHTKYCTITAIVQPCVAGPKAHSGRKRERRRKCQDYMKA